MINKFSLIFVVMLCLTTALRMFLAQRQINNINKYKNHVPDAFSAKISLEEHQKSANYNVTKMYFSIINIFADSLILIGFTMGGGLRYLLSLTSHMSSNQTIQGILLVSSVILISGLLSLPFSIYSTFVIEERFGFNKTTPKLFLLDLIKSILLSAIIGLPAIAVVLLLMNKMGNAWWLWVWCFWVLFSLSMLIIYPTFIAPLFNKFKPLEDGELKTRIEVLLERCGFASKGVFIMDGSKRSSHGNAYFTGFGKSKRIVFFDTLIKQLSCDEIEAVLAHELGHFKLKHVIKRIAFTFISALILLFIMNLLMQSSWFYSGLWLNNSSVALALILFFMLLPIFSFPFSPLLSAMSRHHEYEADAFAAKQSNAKNLISALIKLYKDNASTLTPDNLYSLFYDSHPPAVLRIANLNRQQPPSGQ